MMNEIVIEFISCATARRAKTRECRRENLRRYGAERKVRQGLYDTPTPTLPEDINGYTANELRNLKGAVEDYKNSLMEWFLACKEHNIIIEKGDTKLNELIQAINEQLKEFPQKDETLQEGMRIANQFRGEGINVFQINNSTGTQNIIIRGNELEENPQSVAPKEGQKKKKSKIKPISPLCNDEDLQPIADKIKAVTNSKWFRDECMFDRKRRHLILVLIGVKLLEVGQFKYSTKLPSLNISAYERFLIDYCRIVDPQRKSMNDDISGYKTIIQDGRYKEFWKNFSLEQKEISKYIK